MSTALITRSTKKGVEHGGDLAWVAYCEEGAGCFMNGLLTDSRVPAMPLVTAAAAPCRCLRPT